jgi:hypothetical protein
VIRASAAARTVSLAAAVASLLWFGCAQPTQTAGGASEETNAFVLGKVLVADGAPAAGVEVKLLPTDFDPLAVAPQGLPAVDTTNGAGEYVFFVTDSGMYNVLGTDQSTGEKVLVQGIVVSGEDTVSVLDGGLLPTGSILMTLAGGLAAEQGYLFVPGTDAYAYVDSTSAALGTVLLDAVPSGPSYAVQYRLASASVAAATVAEGTAVAPNDTTSVQQFIVVYSDAINILNGTWEQQGTIVEVTDDAYEGVYSYKFTYDTDTLWAGFAINFGDWAYGEPLDVSAATHLRIAYRGSGTGLTTRLNLVDFDFTGYDDGDEYDLPESNDEWTVVDIPMTEFGTTIDLTRLNEITIGVGDVTGKSGYLYIDAVAFIIGG